MATSSTTVARDGSGDLDEGVGKVVNSGSLSLAGLAQVVVPAHGALVADANDASIAAITSHTLVNYWNRLVKFETREM